MRVTSYLIAFFPVCFLSAALMLDGGIAFEQRNLRLVLKVYYGFHGLQLLIDSFQIQVHKFINESFNGLRGVLH